MKLIEKILADIGGVKSCKPIRPFDVKDLGYVFSKRKVKLKDANYMVLEVANEDTRKPVSFCFLLTKRSNMGIVLPHPFEHYHQLAEEEKKLTKGVKKGQSV